LYQSALKLPVLPQGDLLLHYVIDPQPKAIVGDEYDQRDTDQG
jgi:hypothetical protein